MESNHIKCPQCGTDIEVGEVLSRQVTAEVEEDSIDDVFSESVATEEDDVVSADWEEAEVEMVGVGQDDDPDPDEDGDVVAFETVEPIPDESRGTMYRSSGWKRFFQLSDRARKSRWSSSRPRAFAIWATQ